MTQPPETDAERSRSGGAPLRSFIGAKVPHLRNDVAVFGIVAAGAAALALTAALVIPTGTPGAQVARAQIDGASIETATVRKHGNGGGKHGWSYFGPSGPEHWAGLSGANTACGGEQQSPVNLAGGVEAHTGGFELDWNVKAMSVANNGHTLSLPTPEGASMTIDGTRYHLKQFHFHTPSEHAVEGRRAAMEAHFVHVADDGALAVLAVMMFEGAASGIAADAFAEIIARSTPHEGEADFLGGVSPSAFLPRDTAHLRYHGSLTTPPCAETVLWTVLREPVTVAPADIELFAGFFGANARPLQSMNRRYLLVGE